MVRVRVGLAIGLSDFRTIEPTDYRQTVFANSAIEVNIFRERECSGLQDQITAVQQLDNLVFGRRPMTALVVEVDKRSLHLIHALQLHLERLADVVRLEQIHRPRQNDVDLHEEPVAEVERADRVDVRDPPVVTESDPRQLPEEVRSGCVSRQHLYLLCTTSHILDTDT